MDDVVLRDREAREVIGGVVLVGSPVCQLAYMTTVKAWTGGTDARLSDSM